MNYLRVLSYLYLLLVLCPEASANETTLGMPWVEIHDLQIYVEIASDNASRSRGLMYRDELAKDRGMLFVYPKESVRKFWMINMLIPLDIIYLDSQLRVVSIALDATPCMRVPCVTYSSRVPAMYVLEVNAGIASSLGLQLGNVFRLEQPIFAVP